MNVNILGYFWAFEDASWGWRWRGGGFIRQSVNDGHDGRDRQNGTLIVDGKDLLNFFFKWYLLGQVRIQSGLPY